VCGPPAGDVEECGVVAEAHIASSTQTRAELRDGTSRGISQLAVTEQRHRHHPANVVTSAPASVPIVRIENNGHHLDLVLAEPRTSVVPPG
jgi:hypothetical protein